MLYSIVLPSAQTRLHAPVATHCPYAAFQRLQAQYGNDAVGVFGDGSPTNKKAYLLGNFVRMALTTSQIDYNGRFCMSSAASQKGKHMKGECKCKYYHA